MYVSRLTNGATVITAAQVDGATASFQAAYEDIPVPPQDGRRWAITADFERQTLELEALEDERPAAREFTALELMGQTVTDLELSVIENAQQMTELELMIWEGRGDV